LTTKEFPVNYHLTFSRSEDNDSDVAEIMLMGGNIAVPFYVRKNERLPKLFNGIKVIIGDNSDLRFRDKKNVIVGLKAKGKGRSDSTGFIVRNKV
jgi:hypothetical protein